MKYKNGREIKNGDAVIGTGNNIKGLIVGHVVSLIPGAPPSKDVIKILTHFKAVAHKDAVNATFDTAQEIGLPENFIHAQDAFTLASDVPALKAAPPKAEK